MRELVLDGSDWRTYDDVYSAFFAVVGAPSWHGRNFNALNDSIANGDINSIELPYRIVIKSFDLIDGEAKQMAVHFIDLILEISERGHQVEIQLRNSDGTLLPCKHS